LEGTTVREQGDTEDRGLLITGARVYTADPTRPWAEAIVTRGGRVVYVGGAAEARRQATPRTEQIHMPGALVAPGLNDSHIHLSWGASTFGMVNLEDAHTLPALRDTLRAYAAAHPARPWIEGSGLPYDVFMNLERPERLVLDQAVPDRPVYVRAYDWHTAWANTVALERAGIVHGADLPPPNAVVVDPATGLATGLLKEKLAQDLVEQLIPVPSEQESDELLRRAMRHVNGFGVTSAQNMDGDAARVAQYERLRARDALTVRAAHYLRVRADTPRDHLDAFAALAGTHAGPATLWNRVRGIKLFIDGVVESNTALMLAPYGPAGGMGIADIDPVVYRDIVVAADALGLAVATHAIGDRGVRLALDAYEEARRANGDRAARRLRVEHIEVVHPADIPRFAHPDVVASMQPLHAIVGDDPRTTPWTVMAGPEREPYAFAWRGLLDAGARLSFGSDWPIVTPDPRLGLYAAVTRKALNGAPPGGWQPQQAVTLAQALDAYTRGAAYAEGQEDIKGMLRVGMLADLTVFARDLFTLPATDIPAVHIALTVVDGRVVYRG
jgi:predicted amidohydrolase YtcJ